MPTWYCQCPHMPRRGRQPVRKAGPVSALRRGFARVVITPRVGAELDDRSVKLGLGHQPALFLTAAMNSGRNGSSWSLLGRVLRPIS